MGEGAQFLGNETEQNIEALEKAKQSSQNVETISKKSSQTAQVSTGK